MTVIYRNVRRAMYEEDPAKLLNKSRNFRDMVRLFKPLNWISFILMIFSLASFVVFVVLEKFELLLIVPLGFIVPVVIISILREKYLYNYQPRVAELEEKKQNYKEYIQKIKCILGDNGINTSNKLSELKNECQGTLKIHWDKFSAMNNKVFEIFIGVPLGALIASIIYADGKVASNAIVVIIVVGLLVVCLAKLFQRFLYYSDEHFKDKYLLDILNELNYVSEFFDENG
ncbi:MAG: hypothetical protein FWG94_04070 [Oscillospiraceae bacterium]|nr:hypothetical protein [Oscillospiraceae bacterium]